MNNNSYVTREEYLSLLYAFRNYTAANNATNEAQTIGADTGWVLLTGTLVFFMKTGFAMLEAGAISRSLGVPLILLKNVVDTAISAMAWYLVGFGLAFGDGDGSVDGSSSYNGFIGNSYFASHRIPESSSIDYADWFFQYTFCAVSTTIVSGYIAERTRTTTYFLFSFLYAAWIYPVPVHWVWSRVGFESTGNPNSIIAAGVLDYAGSGAVHLMGGTAGLAACITVGSRYRRWDKIYIEKGAFAPQSHAWMSLGTLMLWFSWIGFNTGSGLSIVGKAETSGLVAENTVLAGAAACLSGLILDKIINNTYSLPVALNSILAGTVAITSGCAFIDPWAAIVTGLVAGPLYVGGVKLFEVVQLDDPVGACSVHFINGIWGLVSPGLFATEHNIMLVTGKSDYAGLFMGSNGGLQFAQQIVAICLYVLWAGCFSTSFYLVAKQFGVLRIPIQKEKEMFQERLDELVRQSLHLQSALPDGVAFSTPSPNARPKPASAAKGREDEIHMSQLS